MASETAMRRPGQGAWHRLMAKQAFWVTIAVFLIPVVLGLLAAFVAYGRARLAPHRGSSFRRSVLQSPT